MNVWFLFLWNFLNTGGRDMTYDDFIEDLQKEGPSECRYGVYDFEYTHQCQGTSEVGICLRFSKFRTVVLFMKIHNKKNRVEYNNCLNFVFLRRLQRSRSSF